MGNKNNNLRHQKYLTLKNSDESFKKLADKVEKITPIGWTSGMGSDNYYTNGQNGRAYDTYKEAVIDIANQKGIK